MATTAQASSILCLPRGNVGRTPASPFLGDRSIKLAPKIVNPPTNRQLQLNAVAPARGYVDTYPYAVEQKGGTFTFPANKRTPLAPGTVPDFTPDDSVVLQWNFALLQIVREMYSTGNPGLPGPPAGARAMGIVNSCMFDAWAAYDNKAVGAFWPNDLRQEAQTDDQNRSKAISTAAALAITTIFPQASTKPIQEVLKRVGLDIIILNDFRQQAPEPPVILGLQAARSVLEAYSNDGSNFPSYMDTTNYAPFNKSETEIMDPNRWTPFSSFVELGGRVRQTGFLLPHWGLANKVAFALSRPDEFRPQAPWDPVADAEEFMKQIDEILAFSKTIGEGGKEGDRLRAVAEYWADGPSNETAPGIHLLQAAFVSRRDKNNIDADIKLFTTLGGTLQDCAITAWDCKRAYDNARMVHPIRILLGKSKIQSWAGPGRGLQTLRGSEWIPYLPNPPFADHISGHSTFAGGAATVLKARTGSEIYGETFVFKKGSSLIEPGLFPKEDVVLKWNTFNDSAVENGISRLYGGIHWDKANLDGQSTGAKVAQKAIARVDGLLSGVRN